MVCKIHFLLIDMKKGSDFLINKYVYHFIDGHYCRIDYFGTKMFLQVEFPAIAKVASVSNSFKINMLVENGNDITAWIDKHKNLIVRIINFNIQQTKINF